MVFYFTDLGAAEKAKTIYPLSKKAFVSTFAQSRKLKLSGLRTDITPKYLSQNKWFWAELL